jgi:hypothetical protein
MMNVPVAVKGPPEVNVISTSTVRNLDLTGSFFEGRSGYVSGPVRRLAAHLEMLLADNGLVLRAEVEGDPHRAGRVVKLVPLNVHQIARGE